MLPLSISLYKIHQYVNFIAQINSSNRHGRLEKRFFHALLIFCETARVMILTNDRRVFMQPCVIYYLDISDRNTAVFQQGRVFLVCCTVIEYIRVDR